MWRYFYRILFIFFILHRIAETQQDDVKTNPKSASLEIQNSKDAESTDDSFRAEQFASDHVKLLSGSSFFASDDSFGPPFWLSKKFHVSCCLGGIPTVNHPELIRNFSFHITSFNVDDQDETSQDCHMFKGSYLLPPPRVSSELSYSVQVICKCPVVRSTHPGIDQYCRRLPSCLNNGFRSLIDPRKCLCLHPFFGENCEKYCDHGEKLRGLDGRDFCSCHPLYRGEECRNALCLNGGHDEGNGRCVCSPNYAGFHCEIDPNKTNGIGVGIQSTRFQRFNDQHSELFTRDISGTIFSLIMIVVLVISMYLLMKHRMNMHTRYLTRRPDFLNACNFPASNPPTSNSRRVELFPLPSGDHSLQFRSFGFMPPAASDDGGPPPYAPYPNRHFGRHHSRLRNEMLPPLPTYEDATKIQGRNNTPDDGVTTPVINTCQLLEENVQQSRCNEIDSPSISEEESADGILSPSVELNSGCSNSADDLHIVHDANMDSPLPKSSDDNEINELDESAEKGNTGQDSHSKKCEM